MSEEKQGDYFVVTVRETISRSYPVRAEGPERAKAKVSSLLAEDRLRRPSLVGEGRGDGEIDAIDVVDSVEPAALAIGGALTESELALLTDSADGRSLDPNPQTFARAAREVLAKNGAGSLRPSRRKRS